MHRTALGIACIAVALLILFVISKPANSDKNPSPLNAPPDVAALPFQAQVVGLQWLNPLHRRDYPTEWELLWTLGLARPNSNDDMVRTEPWRYSKLQAVGIIAYGNEGEETFDGYHEKYLHELLTPFHDIYFSSSEYFYNAHSLTDRATWRELAGIHVEYALPTGRLDPLNAKVRTTALINDNFQIGYASTPEAWSRNTPPDVHVTMGGANAGFTSLTAGLDYLKAHPNETVWVMNWDAPSYPPQDEQINENMVLLVLAGPNYQTGRAPLAWLGYPATSRTADFEAGNGKPARSVQAWSASLHGAAVNAGKSEMAIGYVIHDADNRHAASSDRIAGLAQALATELPDLDYVKDTFNTPALLGEMGAGTALTNVALGIAYANHIGKHVLIAGTTDAAQPTALVVSPPEKVRPFNPDGPWFRARGGGSAFLPWWGLRHDAQDDEQGYSK
ncbi:virulence factor [Pseudoduganella chitinolytica]|uniref:Virulence factor n=1 Tax=Pseudoduganella chitinolytica TaxID=34070 RepID=A0ABY8BFX7_9BURK|nr:virulence factor [Pseudoduganella chitinolytica]WEF33898.1 virulence factor [Pseudoduganella chitinolytica]